ncbi:hypothetical protein F4604DRAFT_1583718 [Suillus subluteus]|nr:hypothetical protein F4604DRAFT_1583718 [Suillus subluteus]
MHKWWKWVHVHDLIHSLFFSYYDLPEPDKHDCDSIELLKSSLKGHVTYPRHSKDIRLQILDPMLYGLVLQFLQDEWGELGFIIHADVVLADHGTCFMGYVKSYLHVFVEALCYGTVTQPHGK